MSDHRYDPEEKFGSHVNLKKDNDADDNAAGKIGKTSERTKPLRKLGSFHSLNDFNSISSTSIARKTSRGTGMFI